LAEVLDLDLELLEQVEELEALVTEQKVRRAIEDPYFWITECTKTRDEQDEENPNKPFPKLQYIESMLNLIFIERTLFVEKSRTVLGTWTGCAAFAWEGFTKPQRRYVFQSADEARSKNCIDYVKWLWENSMPELQARWPLKVPMERQHQMRFELANGTIFQGIVGDPDKIRSMHPTRYMLDEGALIPNGGLFLDNAIGAKPLGIVVISSARPGWFRDFTEPAVMAECPVPLAPGTFFRRTSRGIAVLRVHYTADPSKRSPEWIKKERDRYTDDTTYRLEMEIEYEAKSGELVYPEFDEAFHVCSPKEIPKRGTLYMAIDPHPRTPHAALYVLIDSAGDWWVYREFWPSKSYGKNEKVKAGQDTLYTVTEYAEIIAAIEGNRVRWEGSFGNDRYGVLEESGEKIATRYMDQAGKGFRVNADGQPFESYWEHYERAGFELREPYKIHTAGEDAIRELLKLVPYEGHQLRPRLHVSSNCPELILEFKRYRFQAQPEWRQAVAEIPQDGIPVRTHLLDCLRYLATSNAEHVGYLESDRHTDTDLWRAVA
jgi:hypothetical protein